MDGFMLTILIIFVATLLTSYFKSASRDPVLKDFHGFPVIVFFKNGHTVWGKMNAKSTGFIIEYEKPFDNITHQESGFIIYRNEYPTIEKIVRVVDDLNDDDLTKRKIKSLSYKKSWLSYLRRGFRNFFAGVRDALVDTFGMFVGRMAPQSSVITKNQNYVKKVGESFVDYVNNSYEPVIEYLSGKRIVYETPNGDKWIEHTGITGKYSKDFLEILDSI